MQFTKLNRNNADTQYACNNLYRDIIGGKSYVHRYLMLFA